MIDPATPDPLTAVGPLAAVGGDATTDAGQPSVRSLLAELASLEDALRRCTLADRQKALEREQAILDELHAIRPD